MPTYTRTVTGQQVTIHAPAPGEDLAGFAAFTDSDELFGLDVETTPIDDASPRFFGPDFRVRLVQVGTARQAWVLRPDDPTQRQAIIGLLADESKWFTSHTNYDVLAVWAAFGVPLGQRSIDTHLLACLLEPGQTADHGLKSLSARHIDDGLQQAEGQLHAYFRAIAPPAARTSAAKVAEHGWANADLNAEPYLVYAGLDAVYVYRLLEVLLPLLAPYGQLPRLETWLAAQTTGITVRGLRLDRDYATVLADEFQSRHSAARHRLETLMGFPATSPRRIDWLATRGVEFRHTTDKGRPSLSSKDALPDLLARYSDGQVGTMLADTMELATTQNFANNLATLPDFADSDGRVHPDIRTLAAHTGRMSVKYPAMQTFKKDDKRLRGCFVADPGHVLVTCDFTNMELRVAAALSRDENLIRVFHADTNVHEATGHLVWGDAYEPSKKKLAKALNFGTCFGGGAPGLAKQAGISIEVARDAVSRFRRAYPRIAPFGTEMGRLEVVVNAARRRIPTDPQRSYANSNYAIQSTARDLLVEALYRLCVDEGYHDALWMLIHDEIVLHVPEHQAHQAHDALNRAMTTSFRGVPITADPKIVGRRWGGEDAEKAAQELLGTRMAVAA